MSELLEQEFITLENVRALIREVKSSYDKDDPGMRILISALTMYKEDLKKRIETDSEYRR